MRLITIDSCRGRLSSRSGVRLWPQSAFAVPLWIASKEEPFVWDTSLASVQSEQFVGVSAVALQIIAQVIDAVMLLEENDHGPVPKQYNCLHVSQCFLGDLLQLDDAFQIIDAWLRLQQIGRAIIWET